MKRFLTVILMAVSLAGCGYNDFQRLDEQSNAAWSEVLNQFQRRADLVPNIVATVKGEASFEQAQGELSSALSRLMAVSERYPTLQANQGFRDLRVTLEGTENRITVARNRFIQTVQEYNVLARSFPTNLTAKVFGYDAKPLLKVENEAQISRPPQVDFSAPKP